MIPGTRILFRSDLPGDRPPIWGEYMRAVTRGLELRGIGASKGMTHHIRPDQIVETREPAKEKRR